MKAPKRITEWDRSTIPVPPDTVVNLHICKPDGQGYTLVGKAGRISLEKWAAADWYRVPERESG